MNMSMFIFGRFQVSFPNFSEIHIQFPLRFYGFMSITAGVWSIIPPWNGNLADNTQDVSHLRNAAVVNKSDSVSSGRR